MEGGLSKEAPRAAQREAGRRQEVQQQRADGSSSASRPQTDGERLGSLYAAQRRSHAALVEAQEAVAAHLQPTVGAASSRAGWLRTLDAQIGPPPVRPWRDEWVALSCEHFRMTGQKTEMSDAELAQNCRDVDSTQAYAGWNRSDIETKIQALGWSREHATAYELLRQRCAPIALALREGSPRFAASTYALCAPLYRDAARQQSDAPQRVFANMTSWKKSGRQLLTSDPAWSDLEVPDRNGFCGLTCSSLSRFFVAGDCLFQEQGMCIPDWTTGVDKSSGKRYTMRPADSDVVCVECQKTDAMGNHHAPILVSREFEDTGHEYVFPPNTLFRLKKVEPSFESPCGVRVKQRLLTVTATFRPRELEEAAGVSSLGSRKLCSPAALLYADRSAFIRGLDDILAAPVLPMAHEFDRDQAWTDWKGVQYTAKAEWAYVNGPCIVAQCTPGTRDMHNQGKTPAAFLAEVNAHIAQRRAAGWGDSLPDSHAFLSLEEVLALRLYRCPEVLKSTL